MSQTKPAAQFPHSVTVPTGDALPIEPLSVSDVPPELVDHVWIAQRKNIERGLRHGQGDATTSNEMLASIKQGRLQLWAVHRGGDIQAVVVISLIRKPTNTKLFVHLIAGEKLGEWSDQVQGLLIDFRELLGASCIEASCRPGLAEYLSKKGWSKKAIVMELR